MLARRSCQASLDVDYLKKFFQHFFILFLITEFSHSIIEAMEVLHSDKSRSLSILNSRQNIHTAEPNLRSLRRVEVLVRPSARSQLHVEGGRKDLENYVLRNLRIPESQNLSKREEKYLDAALLAADERLRLLYIRRVIVFQ